MKSLVMPATTLTTLNLKKMAFTLLCCTALMLVLAGTPTAVAQSPYFTDFSSTANLTLNGSAVAPFYNGTSNVLRLTPATGGQAGSAWFNIQQPVAGGFTTTFQFQFTGASESPADGIAFVIQNDTSGIHALDAGGGGSIGYGSNPDTSGGTPISNSLAIEFDTYQNTFESDGNHVAVQSCGTGPNSSDEAATYDDGTPCNLGTNSALPITLADGNPHTVTIVYTPPGGDCGEFCSGTLQVTLDGTALFAPISVNLSSLLSLNGGSAWVGFTSATGFYYENHDILSWTFTPHTSTTIEEIIPPGQQGVFTFGSFNYKATNTTNTTWDVSVEAIPVAMGTTFPPNFSTAQCIVYDGTGGNCWEFQATCISGTCDSADFPLATSYDSSLSSFPGPGFLKGKAPCLGTTFATNQITEFLVQRNDPTTKGTSGGTISCWVATINTPTPFAATVQQPINVDGSSVFSAKRGVVPVKFTITMNGSPTCNLPPATIAVYQTGGSTPVLVDETTYTMAADNGPNFRISGCQYLYNLAAAAMGPGSYEVDILIAGSKVGFATFKLK